STGGRCSNTAWTTCAPSSTAISAGSSIMVLMRSTSRPCRAGSAHEIHPFVVEGPPRDQRVSRANRRQADQYWAGGRRAVEPGRGTGAVQGRQGADGGKAPAG